MEFGRGKGEEEIKRHEGEGNHENRVPGHFGTRWKIGRV
jgi:hypothetical protein